MEPDCCYGGAKRRDLDVDAEVGANGRPGQAQHSASAEREQRDSARSIYEARIRQSPVQGSAEIWAGVRDRWGSPDKPNCSPDRQQQDGGRRLLGSLGLARLAKPQRRPRAKATSTSAQERRLCTRFSTVPFAMLVEVAARLAKVGN